MLPLQLPGRKARQVCEELAEAEKQIEEHKKCEEEMERLLASSNVRMPAQKLRSRILSFENVTARKRRLAEAFISGFSVVPVGSSLKSVGPSIELKEKILSQKCTANEERGRNNVRGAGRLAVVTFEDHLLVMTHLRIRLGWLQQELAYIFGVSEAGVSLTFKEVD